MRASVSVRGLSILSIAFPSIFIVQHYVIYRDTSKDEDEIRPPPADEQTPLLGSA